MGLKIQQIEFILREVQKTLNLKETTMTNFPDSGAKAIIDQLAVQRRADREGAPKVVITPEGRRNILEGFRRAAWILRDAIDGTVRH